MCRIISNRYGQATPDWDRKLADIFDADDIGDLHRSLPQYQPTELVELPNLANRLGLGRLLVKDESTRFGLKAFKALGATYAIYKYLQTYLAKTNRACPVASEFYNRSGLLNVGELTFCTATDGNHGRGVAWVARQLGQPARIYMPSDTVPARIENIRGENAEVVIVNGTYDQAVKQAATDAKTNGWVIVSDTSWPGYEQIPLWIMAGYLTLFREIETALQNQPEIDLVLIPGGVGALAGAAAWYFRKIYPQPGPKLIMVEPTEAACLLESIESPRAEPIMGRGRQDSIMAGLNCGLPSPVAWPLIKHGFSHLMAVSDTDCERAMRQYYWPEAGDQRLISGESGAAGLAGLQVLMSDPTMVQTRGELRLDQYSTVLLLSTEGDTDPESFARLVVNCPPA